jgi:hypothetical protein
MNEIGFYQFFNFLADDPDFNLAPILSNAMNTIQDPTVRNCIKTAAAIAAAYDPAGVGIGELFASLWNAAYPPEKAAWERVFSTLKQLPH